jgi:hypothetical protein
MVAMDDMIIPGSAADVVRRQKEAGLRCAEDLIEEMKEDFPGLKGLWEAVKNEKENGCDGIQKF